MQRLAIFFVATLTAACAAAETYLVSSTIKQNDNVLATPSGLVAAAEETLVGTGDDYSLTLIVKPAPEDSLMVTTKLVVDEERHAFAILVVPGETASVSIGDTALDLTVMPGGTDEG